MKKLTVIILLFFYLGATAQVNKVTLQASGLTCSMCSNAINKSLLTLDFVDKVNANIANSTFDISFKPAMAVDFDRIKRKVEDAGFFVAGFTASVHLDNIVVANDAHVEIGGNTYHFLNGKEQVLTGDIDLKLLDKGFVSAKEFRRNRKYTAMDCYTTGVAGACCTKAGLKSGTRIFHVTI